MLTVSFEINACSKSLRTGEKSPKNSLKGPPCGDSIVIRTHYLKYYTRLWGKSKYIIGDTRKIN